MASWGQKDLQWWGTPDRATQLTTRPKRDPTTVEADQTRGFGQLYLSFILLTGRVWHKAFLRLFQAQGHSPQGLGILQKYIRPRRHFPKEGRLRRQAINLTPPKRVKVWGDSPLRPEGSPVMRHTWLSRAVDNMAGRSATQQLQSRAKHGALVNPSDAPLTCIYGGGESIM